MKRSAKRATKIALSKGWTQVAGEKFFTLQHPCANDRLFISTYTHIGSQEIKARIRRADREIARRSKNKGNQFPHLERTLPEVRDMRHWAVRMWQLRSKYQQAHI